MKLAFYVSCQKPTRTGAVDLIIATNYTACHHDKDGKIECWQQGVPKAQVMHHTSPYMHKEEAQSIAGALDHVLETIVASFTR
jgi:hypothetical protein